MEHRGVEHRAVEHRGVEHRAVEHRAMEHRGVEHRAVEHRAVEHGCGCVLIVRCAGSRQCRAADIHLGGDRFGSDPVLFHVRR